MPTAVVLIVTLIAVVFGCFAVLFTVLVIRDRRQRQRRIEQGVRVVAVVSAVEPMVPPERGRFEQPFWLRFGAPGGPVHSVRFASGFDGIVPSEGWRVTVLFDPGDPANVEITDNPYRHDLSGATTAMPGRRWYGWALAAVTVGLVVWGIALFVAAATGDPAAQQARFLLGVGLVFVAAGVAVGGSGVALLAGALTTASRAVATSGVITHTWHETRSSGTNGATTIYPYSVRFALPDGREVHRRAPESAMLDHNAPGRSVRVAYQPGDPTVFTVGSPRRVLLGPVLVLLLGGVFAGVGFLLAVLA